MEVKDIIKESIIYPKNDYKTFFNIIVISFIIEIINNFWITDESIEFIFNILIVMLFYFLINGYSLSIKANKDYSDNILKFNTKDKVKLGIKYCIVHVIYMVIPLILSLIIAYPIGLYSSLPDLFSSTNMTNISFNSYSYESDIINIFDMILNTVPEEILMNFLESLFLVLLIYMILTIFFSLFEQIALVHLAETNSICSSIKIPNIIGMITKIGWIKYLKVNIIMVVCFFILMIISDILKLIPYIGEYVIGVILTAYTILFFAHCTSLLYMENEEV